MFTQNHATIFLLVCYLCFVCLLTALYFYTSSKTEALKNQILSTRRTTLLENQNNTFFDNISKHKYIDDLSQQKQRFQQLQQNLRKQTALLSTIQSSTDDTRAETVFDSCTRLKREPLVLQHLLLSTNKEIEQSKENGATAQLLLLALDETKTNFIQPRIDQLDKGAIEITELPS